MKPGAIVIKKYGNRRLYDAAGSRYVNLDDIAAFVREGKEIQVVDAKTGQDLTRVTLTQVIMEDAKEKPTGLPLELLRQLVVASDEVRQEFVMWYLKSAFDAYQKVQDAVQSRFWRGPVRYSVPHGNDEDGSGRTAISTAASSDRAGTRWPAQASPVDALGCRVPTGRALSGCPVTLRAFPRGLGRRPAHKQQRCGWGSLTTVANEPSIAIEQASSSYSFRFPELSQPI